MDILVTEEVVPSEILEKLRAHLPMGFGVIKAEEVPLKSASLMSSVTGFKYRIVPPAETDLATLRSKIIEVMASDEILVQRKLKAKGRRRRTGFRDVNIKQMVAGLSMVEDDGITEVIFETKRHEEKLAKWREVLGVLGLPEETSRVIKTHTYLA
jgi:radical SAM-linked protein